MPLPLIFLFFSLSLSTPFIFVSLTTLSISSLLTYLMRLYNFPSNSSHSLLLLLCPELCEHLSHIDPREGVIPAAVIACAPLMSRDTMPFAVSEEEVS